jgi:hypothetical protein
VIAIGGFEVSENEDLDGRRYWAGHLHLIVAGTSRHTLKRALAIQSQYRQRPYCRPVDIRQPGANLGQRLGYCLKRVFKRRVAYIDGQGRQNRNELPLRLKQQIELDQWLLNLPLGARTILIGCRMHGNRLCVFKG